MRSRFLLLTLVGLLAVACGSEKTATLDVTKGSRAAEATDVDIGKLVPQNAMAVVYAPSFDGLVEKVRGVVATVDADEAANLQPSELRDQMGGPMAKFWDGSRPFALCVAMSPKGEPIPTMIMPITDVAKAKEVQGGPPRVFSGSYMSMVMGNAAPSEPSTSTHRLLEDPITNDLTLRIDLAGLVQAFGDQIDGAMGEVTEGATQMGGAGDMVKGMMEKVMSFVKSAEMADVGISMSGGDVDLRFAVTMKAGSEFDRPMPKGSGQASSYAKMLPSGFPIQGVMHMDTSLIAELMDWVTKMMQETLGDDPQFQGMAEYMADMRELTKLVGPNYAMGFGMGDGVQMVYVADSSDAETYFAKMKAALAKGFTDKMGVKYEELPSSQVGSVDVHTYKVTMDMKKLMGASGQQAPPDEAMEQVDGMMKLFFGSDGMVMHMAGVNGKIVASMGGMDKMKEAIQFAQSGSGSVSPGLAKAIKYAGGSPTLALDIDLRAFLKQLRPMLTEAGADNMPAVPDGDPARIVVYGGRDGRVYRGGLSLAVGEIANIVKAMDK